MSTSASDFAILKARVTSYREGGKRVQVRPSAPIVEGDKATPTDAAKRLLRAILDDETIPGYWCREFTFDDVRDFRIDVAAPLEKLGVECDGGVHRIKKNFLRDLTKHNLLTLAGWRYIRVTPAQVDTGEALVLVRALVNREGK